MPYHTKNTSLFPLITFYFLFIYREARIQIGFNVGLMRKFVSQNLSINTRRALLTIDHPVRSQRDILSRRREEEHVPLECGGGTHPSPSKLIIPLGVGETSSLDIVELERHPLPTSWRRNTFHYSVVEEEHIPSHLDLI